VPEFLLEIGVEEMPASWLPGLTEQMRQRFSEIAEREHLDPQAVASYSTPRRLIVTAPVAARQADREDKVWGPSLKVARDPAGAWTGPPLGSPRRTASPWNSSSRRPRIRRRRRKSISST
jgi:glycyl-tRNA synthetase beta chain